VIAAHKEAVGSGPFLQAARLGAIQPTIHQSLTEICQPYLVLGESMAGTFVFERYQIVAIYFLFILVCGSPRDSARSSVEPACVSETTI
jgi:hypothetical protein